MQHVTAQFENQAIRRAYDEGTETWWFSVADIVQVLTQQPDFQSARKYWNKLKTRLNAEGSESVTKCHRLKLPAADGKSYLTDVGWRESEKNSAWIKGITGDKEQACICFIPFIPFIQAIKALPVYSVREFWRRKVALIFQSSEAKPIQKAVS